MITRLRVGVFALIALAVAACRPPAPVIPAVVAPPVAPAPSPAAIWGAVQANTLAALVEGKVTFADSMLLTFARTRPGTLEGARALWWRVLMRTDPTLGISGVPQALAQLDSLLADTLVNEVRSEGAMLRRGLVQVDSARRADIRRQRETARATAERQDELRAMRDSMAKLVTEVERLRRRLRAP
jgi:hypothetical protein